MIRITVRAQTPTGVVLQIEGNISEQTVETLKAEGDFWVASHKDRLVLDLAGVRFIDATGIALLRGWRSEGLVLRRPSRFIGALLDRQGLYAAESREHGSK